MAKFDSKTFNPEVFGMYVDRVPKMRRNEIVKSGAIEEDADLAAMLAPQTGGNYITKPIYGLIGGSPLNYDGETNLTSTTDDSYEQSFIVIGRMKGFKEKDFTTELTGKDFMDNVAAQVAGYWEDVEQDLILSVLKGVFSMSASGADANFVAKHTYSVNGSVTATTLNNATQKANGDNKQAYVFAFMHSRVATTLENLQLLEFLKYTDAQGIERNMNIAQWGSKIVLIDDTMPTTFTDAVYALTEDEDIVLGKTYYTRTGSGTSQSPYVYTPVANPVKTSLSSYYEMTAAAYTTYTTYVLGKGSIIHADCGAKVPYEMARDPKTNGGEDELLTRNRQVIALKGFSFTKSSMSTKSPTDAELETGANWTLVNNGSGTAIDDKAILVCRILSIEPDI